MFYNFERMENNIMKSLMKKWLCICLVAAVFSMTACGSDDASDNSGNKTGENKTISHEAKGYVFEYNGVKIGADMDAAAIVSAIGEDETKSYYEAPSCAFQGLDKVYGYGSFEINTYELDGKDYVSSVLFKDDTVSTKEGVSLFMTKDDMVKAYGSDYSDEQGMYVYEKEGMKLKFLIENEEITSIEYASTILD